MKEIQHDQLYVKFKNILEPKNTLMNSIMYGIIEALYHIPEANVTLYVNHVIINYVNSKKKKPCGTKHCLGIQTYAAKVQENGMSNY